ncbi:DNA ligase [Ferribacterium limneticum]|uniref:DNA ligase n=1 Tax=Ferribacterium limneticum TaxID=76259 RepID=UPI001CFBDCA6|nr:DNA ligase [Ferribacterium limneticum]UCV27222.1 DNA ligase [Ferribacterium limneticum]UCV31139.1 DNA ligase [Ferribacterium limneticum]
MSRLLGALLFGLALSLPIVSCAVEPPAILLANVYREQVDVSRYLVSEKLDGVRAIWDGQVLRFRSGKTIHAPDWFIAGLPEQALDGELWIARGQFERVSGIVRREVPDEAGWREVRYMIFELPGAPGTFSERAERIRRLVHQANVPWLREIEQFSVANRTSLKKHLDEVVKGGGEGLMLHLADAAYETGRSDVLLKLKPWQDAEAVVVAHQAGKGRFAGYLGALKVRTPDGREFLLGTGFSKAQRQQPPAIGTTVTYRFRDLTNKGMPRFACFLRVRND